MSKRMMNSEARAKILFRAALICAALALTGCGGSQNGSDSVKAASGAPAPQVTVSVAAQQSVPIEIQAIGNAQAYRAVQVKSMVDGQIDRVLLKQGDYVHAGQLMFELDKRPFQAALDQAVGNLAKDQATAANNQANSQRAQALLKEGVLAVQDAQTTESAAQASLAAVQADKAAVQTARVASSPGCSPLSPGPWPSSQPLDRAPPGMGACRVQTSTARHGHNRPASAARDQSAHPP